MLTVGHRAAALIAHLTKNIICTNAVNDLMQIRASFVTLSDVVLSPSVLKLAISNRSGDPCDIGIAY